MPIRALRLIKGGRLWRIKTSSWKKTRSKDDSLWVVLYRDDHIDKDLAEGTYDHVQTRFHRSQMAICIIGYAKSILLNSGLAKEYNGKFNLRFDDTTKSRKD